MAMYSTQTPPYGVGVNNPPTHAQQPQYYQQSMPGPSSYPAATYAQPQPPQAYPQHPQQQQQWYGQHQQQHAPVPAPAPPAPQPQLPQQYQQPQQQQQPPPQPAYHQQSFGGHPQQQQQQQPYAHQSFGQQAYPQQTYGSYGQQTNHSQHSQPSPHASYHSHPTHSSYGQHQVPQQYGTQPQQQYPQQSLPQQGHPGQQAYQQSYAAQPYLEQQTPPPAPLSRTATVAIPSPQRKTDYQAPAFKTFQERKREREAALRAAANGSAPATPSTPPPKAQAVASPARPSPSPSQPNLPPHVLAMMGRPGGQGQPTPQPRANASPAPPQRQPSTSQPQPPQRSPSPQPPQRAPSPQPPQRAPSSPQPPQRGFPQPPQRSVSPQPPQRSVSPQPPQRSVSPQPPQRSVSPQPSQRSVSPQPPQRSVSPQPPHRRASPQPPQRAPSPQPHHSSLDGYKLPPASVSKFAPPPPPPSWIFSGSEPAAPEDKPAETAPASPPKQDPLPRASVAPPSPQPARMSMPTTSSANGVNTTPSNSSGRALPSPSGAPADAAPAQSAYQMMKFGGLPSNIPRNKAVEALLQRSDTNASVKSLDRGSFGPGKRILPQPPVGVAPSMSLDRGAMSAAAGLRRKSPSPILEEGPDDLADRLSNMGIRGDGSRSPTSNGSASPRTPLTPAGFPQVNVPSIVTSDIPAINVGGDDTPKVPHINIGSPPKSPARGLPSISVGSPPKINVGPPSPNVPAINVGSPPKGPSIRVASPVQPSPRPPAINVPPPNISIGAPPSPIARPASPSGFEFSGLPTIAVESSDTRFQPAPPPPPTHGRAPSPVTRVQPSSAILCAGCNEPIIGRIVSAMGKRFHPPCFQCGVCGEHLEHVSAYEHDGQPYCHLDYHDRFANKCHHCRTPIVDPRFITLNDEVLGQRFYHELHFFCSECGDPFLDPSKSSSAGTELNRPHRHGGEEEEEGDETNAFVIHKGHPYCERCHLKLHKPKCKACRQPIPDIAVGALGGKWHKECFVCEQCKGAFANNLFFPIEGKAFCVECFEGMQ